MRTPPDSPDHDPAPARDRQRGLTLLGAAVAILVASVCVRLGFWQLHRLGERRALNERIGARQSQSPLDLRGPLPAADSLVWRRVETIGAYDTTVLYLLRDRSLQQVPGVDLVVPFHPAGGPLAFLVNRGWLPAPDGESANPRGLTPGGPVRVSGVLVPAVAARGSQTPRPVRGTTGVFGWRWLETGRLSRERGTPIHPLILQELPAAGAPSWPRRRSVPLPTDGPHLSYALQWFGFAAVVLAGSLALAGRRLRRLR